MDDLVSNRRAYHNYEILETFEAGMALMGSEVKSLRSHHGSLQEAYVLVTDKGEVILKNATIAPYSYGAHFGHEERRERKLLLHKREIQKLRDAARLKGLTIVPLSIYIRRGNIKIKIGIARGKKAYDKRAALKEKEHRRAIKES